MTRMLYLVACAAPPAQSISDPVKLLQAMDWSVCVVATPRAMSWMDAGSLAELTGFPVRHENRMPDSSNSLPHADAIAVVPATFNTINKWVAGISDNLALGLLNEAIGLKLPVVVVPYAKPSLAAHPAFNPNLQTLRDWGVTVLRTEAIRVGAARDVFDWRPLIDALDHV